ncbi:hypothetical protein EHS25_009361 [Saitozyma podzolica]|uniref:Uncharacterized protein n=1 Tax=Saitozyma podzolica TaxID=1890683 RepID=A0A427YLQ1_9TREE|nr:hypothetical protein EHS25_009361 [Saitozyma podzolica]
MLETIYICRHGARQDWLDPAHVSVTKLYHDPSLSEQGLEQAQHLGDFLSAPEDSPVPELIFSSPFYRCVQTSRPLAQKLGEPVHLEMGVMEWFSKAREGSGLHTRPHATSPKALVPHFPEITLHPTYTHTYYPSRRGEAVEELHARIEGFLAAWVNRVQADWPEVKTVVIFAHAATVIALGRALVGDNHLDVRSGTCSTSKYVRKAAPNGHANGQANGQANGHASASLPALGTWDIEWNGKTSYLPGGELRSWSGGQVHPEGTVVEDQGDGLSFRDEDELPLGLAKGMEKHVFI